MIEGSHTARLLVATPLIGDTHFERSVVLLLAHGAEGAFGVIVNRPSDTLVDEVAPQWRGHVTWPASVFIGGPVAPDTLVGLGRPMDAESVSGFTAMGAGLGVVDLTRPPPTDSADASRWAGLRLFAGSAGWAPGQVEDEIADGAWWPVDPAPDDILTADPAGLWQRVVRRQKGTTAWFANCPVDVSAN